jgi:hypothetical protein
VILLVVQIPIAFLNELNSLAALLLVRGADFLSHIRQASAGGSGHALPQSPFSGTCC